MRELNKTKQNLKKKKRREKNEDLRTLKLDSVTWLKVKGERKEEVVGRAGESDQKCSDHLTKRWVS